MELQAQLLTQLWTTPKVGCVISPGLDEPTILESLLRLASRRLKSLVVVLDAPHNFTLPSSSFRLPNLSVIAEGCDIASRTAIYNRPGLVSLSSRTFSTDLLLNRLNASFIGCLVICQAHKCSREHPAAFALRLVIDKNPKVFIKALTSNVYSFQYSTFSTSVPVTKLIIKSHNDEVVRNTLDSLVPVTNLSVVPLSGDADVAVDLISQMISIVLADFNSKLNSNYQVLDVTTWNISFREGVEELNTRFPSTTIVYDLSVLKGLFYSVLYSNCVDALFELIRYHLDALYLSHVSTEASPPLWPFLEGATQLLEVLRRRVLIKESSPLLSYVNDLLKGYQRTQGLGTDDILSSPSPILVICRNWRTSKRLSDFLNDQSEHTDISRCLLSSFIEFKLIDSDQVGFTPREFRKHLYYDLPPSKIQSTVSRLLNFSDSIIAGFDLKEDDLIVEDDIGTLLDNSAELTLEPAALTFAPVFVVQAHKVNVALLRQIRPQVIITANPTIASLRNVELYCATTENSKNCIDVHCVFAGKPEQELYSASIDRENKIMNHLKSMADYHTPPPLFSRQSCKGSILVDTREFRSSLPLALFEKGLEVVPVTLITGDYVLSPDVAVERKTLSDLSSSLNSGHLIKQARRMSNHFTHSVILIESGNKSSSSESEPLTALITRVVSLLLRFPFLRLAWSFGPLDGASLLSSLKKNLPEPSVEKMSHLLEAHDFAEEESNLSFNSSIDSLGKLFGDEFKSDIVGSLANNNCNSLSDFFNLDQQEMCKILDANVGQQFGDFVEKTPNLKDFMEKK
ncbi:hypothetical protein P9112_007433 [Eukaryota sp. TZLM1-RC]